MADMNPIILVDGMGEQAVISFSAQGLPSADRSDSCQYIAKAWHLDYPLIIQAGQELPISLDTHGRLIATMRRTEPT